MAGGVHDPLESGDGGVGSRALHPRDGGLAHAKSATEFGLRDTGPKAGFPDEFAAVLITLRLYSSLVVRGGGGRGSSLRWETSCVKESRK
jgi:hypothetical protein